MKKRETRRPRREGRIRLLFVLTMLFLSACTPQKKQPEGWLLYYTTDNSSTYGSAIAAQVWAGSETPTGEELMQALLDGPAEEGLVSPFPKGLSVQSMELEGEIMRLTLSEQYSGLTDISRTLADACIVMTVCQLPGVESVEISSVGFWASAPAKRDLSPEQLRLEMLLP
jgi:spore germination protein GerM